MTAEITRLIRPSFFLRGNNLPPTTPAPSTAGPNAVRRARGPASPEMTLKQFNADVAAAKSCTLPCVSNIRRGDSDGEVVFTFDHEVLDCSMDIQALTPDPELYPQKSNFMIFTAAELANLDVESALENLTPDCNGRTVLDVIFTISRKLAAWLMNPSASEDEDEAWTDDDHDGLDDLEGFGWEELGVHHPSNAESAYPISAPMSRTVRERLGRDLHATRSAGIHVGLLKLYNSQIADTASLSIRASKLGILEETLEAWGLQASDYLVLLLHYPKGYPSTSEFLQSAPNKSDLRLRFGKCAATKPSMKSARWAFSDPTSRRFRATEKETTNSDLNDCKDDFHPLHMSASIDSLLNEQLSALISLRRSYTISWDNAQNLLFQISRDSGVTSKELDAMEGVQSVESDEEHIITKVAPKGLHHDYAMDSDETFNVSLVCMQFALRRFAKCTKYCMVCHQKMQGEFEAVKPYVCSDSLCLYQYLSLGLGTTIEHEIISNPHVVDLLISFFHTGLNQKSVREFPRGLGLKAFSTGTLAEPDHHFPADAYFPERVLRFGGNSQDTKPFLREGNTFLLIISSVGSVSLLDTYGHASERHICRVNSMSENLCYFQILQTSTAPLEAQHNSLDQAPQSWSFTLKSSEKSDWIEAMVFIQEKEIDGLNQDERDIALLHLMNRIPSVLDMRKYLIEKPGCPLDTMTLLDANALALLRWIIASNTSLLVQDDEVPNPAAIISRNHAGKRKVLGLEDGWMQFRFVQGSPEKELRFVEALESMKENNSIPKKFPTMFAWHGSPVNNWHSIIRSGLDFQSVIHGRAYGNGVYFSNTMSTSLSYTGAHQSSVGLKMGPYWLNSHLRVSSAISLCEIINCPKGFVSSTPYYVVNKTEWIQCRYLFVKVEPTSEAYIGSLLKPSDDPYDGYLALDPKSQPRGKKGEPIEIPLSALPAGRRLNFGTRLLHSTDLSPPTPSKLGSMRNPIDVSDDEGDDDIDLQLQLSSSDGGEDEWVQVNEGKRRRDSSINPTDLAGRASKLRITGQGPKPTPGDSLVGPRNHTLFQPGVLDLESLPKLPEPEWASSMAPSALRLMNKEVKSLQSLQSTSRIETLGWYINFEKLSNVFHWIVELHSFDLDLPLAQDMEKLGHSSIVLELRFGSSYPMSPPFVRVIRPRFRTFAQGGGGHVTAGGAICSELLTNSGWSPALSMDKVFLDVRLQISDINPPARLVQSSQGDYGIIEAADAYRRAVRSHGWEIPKDLDEIVRATWN